jgi:hypothetical protein
VAILYSTQDVDIDLGVGSVATVAAVGPLHGALVDLVSINGPWGRNANYAALVAAICTGAGYAQGVVTWDAPSLDTTGRVVVTGTVPAFRLTGSTPGQTAFGLVVQNGAASKMYFNGPLDNPQTFAGPLDQVTVVILWYPDTQQVAIQIV